MKYSVVVIEDVNGKFWCSKSEDFGDWDSATHYTQREIDLSLKLDLEEAVKVRPCKLSTYFMFSESGPES